MSIKKVLIILVCSAIITLLSLFLIEFSMAYFNTYLNPLSKPGFPFSVLILGLISLISAIVCCFSLGHSIVLLFIRVIRLLRLGDNI